MSTDESHRGKSIGTALTRPTERTTLLVVGVLCVVTGGLLLLKRHEAHGLRLWPMILVVVGLVGIGSAPPEQRDEALWLVGTGCWLLASTVAPVFLRAIGPFMMVGAGLAIFRWALAAVPTQEDAHVN
jgi:hypothetical protein